MNNDENPQGEPPNLEEFDMDDIEEDETWDEADEDGAPEAVSVKSAAAPGGKSFVQKYFYFIVAGVVVVFGGLLAFGMMGGSSSPQAPAADAQGQGIVELAPDANMPPMPAPINTVPEENTQGAAPAETTPAPVIQAENTAPSDNNVLTPMPAKEKEKSAAPADKDSGALPLSDFDFSKLPEVPEEAPQKEQPKQQNPVPVAEKAPAPAMEMPALEEADSATTGQAEMPEAVPENALVSEPVAPAPPESKAVNDEVDHKIRALDKKLAATQEQIDGLAKTMASLDKKLDDLIEKQTQAPVPAKETKASMSRPVKKSSVSSKPQAKKPAGQKTVKAPVAPPKTAQWVLRAAQPGRAVVAPPGSNDLKTVEVGGTLTGIGRITSISLNQGHWTVVGTQGSITQ